MYFTHVAAAAAADDDKKNNNNSAYLLQKTAILGTFYIIQQVDTAF